MYQETLYDRLGLTRDATPDEIRRAYRDMAHRLHPDKNIRPGETELFIDVQQAYEILTEPKRRAAYDQELPPEPLGFQPVTINVLFSRTSVVRISDPQLIYVLLELRSHPDTEVLTTPPLNICLVLDCSTSMQGARLDTVKNTAIELIRQFQSQDICSIVIFSDRAEVLIPAGSRYDRKQVEIRIQLLRAGGGTEIYQGLEKGFNEVRRYRSPRHINHMILITDGRTYGDEKDCLQLADQAATLAIGISSLGIGSQWNDAFLDQMSSRTGGNSKYISKTEDIRRFLLEKVAGLGHSFAEHVTYNFDTSPGVQLGYAFRLSPDSSPLEPLNPLALGSVPRDQTHLLLLEFIVTDLPSDSEVVTLVQGRVSYQIPTHPSKPIFIQRLDLTRPISTEFDAEPPPPSIVQAMSRLMLYRMQERARDDLKKGNILEATRRLQNLATHLLAQGQNELARSVLGEVDYIQQRQSYSEDGEKRIKYGTRSLLLPSGKEE